MIARSSKRRLHSILGSSSARAAVALIAASALIAGCGSDNNNDDGGTAPPPSGGTPQPPAPPAGGAISASNQCQAYPTVTAAGITGSVAAAVSNPQNRTLSFTLTTDAARGKVNLASNGAFTYTSTEKNRGFSDSFTYSVSDGQGGTATATAKVVYGKARIMPLGDSITKGVETYDGTDGPADAAQVAYRAQLYELLTQGNYQFDFVGRRKNGEAAGLTDPDHEGWGGFDTNQVVNEVLTPALTANTPDVVLTHLGTNDINDNRSATPSATPMQDLLSAARTWSTANQPMHVVVARIINFRTGEAGADKVSVLNDAVTTMINQNFATPGALKVSQADFQSATIDMTPAGADVTGLHPSRAGYDAMARVWYDALVAQKVIDRCE